jgi:catechol 2,3-dioxygenase-like lactoylglutathione lyase family enzyme
MAPQLNDLCTLIQVFDMAVSVEFYCGTLGFTIAQQSPVFDQPYRHFNWALLRRGDISLMLNTAYEADGRPPSPDPGRIAAHGDTILYFACPDVDDAFRQLKSAGVAVAPPTIAPYGMKQVHFSDPDGYAICLQWPG